MVADDPEQVSVNVADLETICRWWREGDHDTRSVSVAEAFDNLAAAIPEPEWEITDDSVTFLARFLLEHDHCGDERWNGVSQQLRDWYRSLATDVLRAMHREGLL